MKTEHHARFDDFLFRPDAYDDYIIREQGSYKHLNIEPGESVLDIGAQIGAFARWAIEQGAGQITCVEPEIENLKLLENNVMGQKVRILAGAAVDNDDPTIDLFVNAKKNKGLHTTHRVRGRVAMRVPCFRFSKLMTKYRPAILKVDIEGGEYHLDWSKALDGHKPRMIGLELHLTRREWRGGMAAELIDLIEWNGYNAVSKKDIPPTNWTMMAFFQRAGS